MKQSYLLTSESRRVLGERLRTLRESANLDQKELGPRLKVHSESIGHIERGTRAISLPLLLAYLDAVGARRPKLLEGLAVELSGGE